MRIIIMALMALMVSSASSAKVMVVVSSDNPVASITKSDLANIYSGRKLVWDNGEPISIFTLPESSQIQEEFCQEVLNSTAIDYSIHVQSLRAQNRLLNTPKQMRSPRSLIRKLRSNKSAIGYISDEKDLRDGVKVILTID